MHLFLASFSSWAIFIVLVTRYVAREGRLGGLGGLGAELGGGGQRVLLTLGRCGVNLYILPRRGGIRCLITTMRLFSFFTYLKRG